MYAVTGLKTGKDVAIEKVTINLHMAPDGLKADNFLAVLPALGQLTGAGTLDSRNALDFNMLATLSKEAGAAAGPPRGRVRGVFWAARRRGRGGEKAVESCLPILRPTSPPPLSS